MKFTPSHLKDAAVVDLAVVADERGYFGRVWIESEAERAG